MRLPDRGLNDKEVCGLSGQGYFMFSNQPKNKASQNVVAYASYCSDERLEDEEENRFHQFMNHDQKPVSFIMKPEHAPSWALDRERLWNEVKKIEKGINYRTHRDIKLSLPVELEREDHIQMTKDFVQNQLVNKGMICDVSLHLEKEHNPHVHVIATVRPMKEDGTWGDKKNKIKQYDKEGNVKRKPDGKIIYDYVPTTDWEKKETLIEQRKAWADINNKYVQAKGIDVKFSHLSYEDQGLEKQATVRLTRMEYEMEKKEKERASIQGIEYKPLTERGRINELVRQANEALKERDRLIEKQKLEAQKPYESYNTDEPEEQDNPSYNVVQKARDNIKHYADYAENNMDEFQLHAKDIALRKIGKYQNKKAPLSEISVTELKKLRDKVQPENSTWHSNLMQEKVKTEAKKEFLNKMAELYNDDNNKVAVYGLPTDPKKFEAYLSNQVEEVKKEAKTTQGKLKAFYKELESIDFMYKVRSEVIERAYKNTFDAEHKQGPPDIYDSPIIYKENRLLDPTKERFSTAQFNFHHEGTAQQKAKNITITQRTLDKLNKELEENDPTPEQYMKIMETKKLLEYHHADLDNYKQFLSESQLEEISEESFNSVVYHSQDTPTTTNQNNDPYRSSDDIASSDIPHEATEEKKSSGIDNIIDVLNQADKGQQADDSEERRNRMKKKKKKKKLDDYSR